MIDAIIDIDQGFLIGPVLLIVIDFNDFPDHLAADSLLFSDGVEVSKDPLTSTPVYPKIGS